MRIGSDTHYIDLSEQERAPKGVPNEGDVRVSVEVRLGEFQGRYDSVWLEEPRLREFVAALATIEHERNGRVVLEGCSPDEFVLTIRSRDTQGHFVAEVSLCRYQYNGPTYWPTLVSGGFELNPSTLPSVLNDFQLLHESNG